MLTQKVPIIGGWNLYQIVFVMSLWRFSHGFFVTFFQQIWSSEYLIREGLMDRILVRPLNPLFQFFAMRIQIYGFGDLMAGIGGLAYAAPHIGQWSMLKLFFLIIIILSGAAIEWALMTMLVSCSSSIVSFIATKMSNNQHDNGKRDYIDRKYILNPHTICILHDRICT